VTGGDGFAPDRSGDTEQEPMKSWYLGIAVAVVMTLLSIFAGA
jgi:hypothetical protein